MRSHIPVTILSGFLGSGKTTLLNRILTSSQKQRYALIINEFGEIGIDGSLVNASQDFVKMDNGCLCCVLNEELEKTIAKLRERDDYDAVILETTGIADPLPIAWTFLRPQFGDSYRFAGIVTVVDALHVDTMLTQAEEVQIQIERADYCYVSKDDACSPEQLDQVLQKIQSLNANARCVKASDEQALSLLFSFLSEDNASLAEQTSHHHHGHGFESVSVALDQKKIPLEHMEDCFENLPHEVFRAKAVFEDPNQQVYVIHSVCGRVDFYELDHRPSELAVVFIGKGLDKENLNDLMRQNVPDAF